MHLVIGTILLVSAITVLIGLAGYAIDRGTARERKE